MTFSLVTEAYLNDSWTAISGDTLHATGVSITRGKQDGDSSINPASCSVTLTDNKGLLNNRTPGQYNPRNPRSPYYGSIGINTPFRVRVDDVFPAPTIRALSTSEFSGGTTTISVPTGAVAGEDSLILFHSASTTGSFDSLVTGMLRGPQDGRRWNKIIDMSNIENGQSIVTLVWWRPYRADDPSSFTLSQTTNGFGCVALAAVQGSNLAPPSVASEYNHAIAGSTSITTPTCQPATAADLELRWAVALDTTGGSSSITWAPPAGYSEQADLQAGAWTTASLASKALSSSSSSGSQTFTATVPAGTLDQAHGVTVQFASEAVRFVGEVPAWPTRWDITGTDIQSSITAYDAWSRLAGPTSRTLRSPLFRAHTFGGPIAWWPGEDGTDATVAASGVPGIAPMEGSKKHSYAVADSTVAFGSTGDGGAAALIDLSGGGALQGKVPTADNNGQSQRFETVALFSKGKGSATDSNFVTFFTGDYEWTLIVDNAALQLDVIRVSPADHPIALSYSTAELYDDRLHHYAVNITWDSVGLTNTINLYLDGVLVGTTNWAAGSAPVPAIRDVVYNFRKGSGDTMPKVGHAAVYAPIPDDLTTADATDGHAGELAADRIERLCLEEGVAFAFWGDADRGQQLGVQAQATFTSLVEEAAKADQGFLYSPRGFLGLAYRDRWSMYGQDAVSFAYSGNLSGALTPTYDPTLARNRVTITRTNGSSYTASENDGPLGIDRVGEIEDPQTYPLYSDKQLPNVATWRLGIGTLDEDRYPVIPIALHRTPFTSSSSMTQSVAGLDIADALTITDPPTWCPPDPVETIPIGFKEVLTRFTWDIAANAIPAAPYRGWTMEDDEVGRLHTNGSALGEALSAQSGAALNSNPNFETTISPWTGSGGTVVRSTGQAHEGTAAGFLTPDGVTSGVRILSEAVTGLSASAVYRAEGWVYCAVTRNVSLQVLWQDSGGGSLSTSSTSFPVTANTWTYLAASYTSPGSTARGVLRFELGSTPSASNTLYVDEAMLTAQTTVKVATTDRSAPKWTTDTAQVPFKIKFGGEVAQVNSVTDHTLSYVAVGSAAHGTAASVTPSAPAGRQAGDLLIMVAAVRGTSATVNLPVGYVRWPVFKTTDNVAVFARIATNTAADLPAVSFTNAGVTDTTSVQLAAFRSSGSTFYSAENCYLASAECLNTSAQNIQCPGLRKPLSDNCLILYIGWKADDWTSVATLSGATEIAEPSSTLGDDQGIVWDYVVQTSRAVLAAQSFTVTGGAAAISRGAVVAVRSDMQTFTLTRGQLGSFNKAHTAGTGVALYPRSTMAL